MPRYEITVCVTSAAGTQTFAVDAVDERDALRVFNRDGGKFVREEVEVMGLDSADIDAVEEVNEAAKDNTESEP